MTTTVSSPLQTFLHGNRLAHLTDLDELLREPEFASSSPSTNTERNLRTYARLAAVARHEGGAVGLAADTERLNTVQEWMAVADPCVFHAALVHFAVCTWAIRTLGRPDAYLAELTDDLDRQRAAGSILVPEIGRSNSHIAIATEARFDPQARTFHLHTPDDGAAKIMANVAQPGVPKIAIVFAELLVGERRCGVFPFAMRIQTQRGPAHGVRVAALSDAPAVPLDYALVRFDDARSPSTAGCAIRPPSTPTARSTTRSEAARSGRCGRSRSARTRRSAPPSGSPPRHARASRSPSAMRASG